METRWVVDDYSFHVVVEWWIMLVRQVVMRHRDRSTQAVAHHEHVIRLRLRWAWFNKENIKSR